MKRLDPLKIVLLGWIPLALALVLASAGPTAAEERRLLKTTLDNGLTVILEEDRSAPVAAFQMWVRVGSADETSAEAGIAHVFEHMLFKGTQKRKVGEIAAEVDAAGGYINAYTSYDTTVYHLAVASRYFSKGLDIISDAIQRSSFDPMELEKEKEVVLEELKMNEDAPERKLYKTLLGTAYKTHPYKKPVIGYEETVKAFTSEQMVGFFEKWYTPGNMALVVVGDFDTGEALVSIKETFKDFKRTEPLQRSRISEGAQTEPRVVITALNITQTRLSIGWHIPELKHKDTYALDILANILGQGVSSRLYKALKSDTNLVYSISAYAMTPKDPGLFIITVSLKTENVEKAIERIFTELKRLYSEGPASDEMKKAKLSLESDFIYDRETMEGKADQLGYYETVSGDLSFEKKYIEGINKVSADDIKKVIPDYLHAKNMSVSALVPEKEKDIITTAKIIGTIPAAKQEEITRIRLENGITVIIKEDRTNPVVAFYATVPGGLRYETTMINGVSNFAAGMLTRGTAKLSREALASEVEGMAGSIGGFSGRNSMGISSRFLARDFSKGLDITADVIFNPAFPEDEIERFRTDIIASIKREEDYLAEHTFKLLQKTLFKTHPY
ncbi:MAG: insulinase family protein, partial [Deltaproteobacteria bacterium]|nr:insulinase family protein [Deltaproteobacteria bacterium]